jgi:FKBP-type peptidyl-prolyl cis-trans isomerase
MLIIRSLTIKIIFMKLRNVLLMVVAVVTFSSCNTQVVQREKIAISNLTDTISYIVGQDYATDIQARTYKVNPEVVIKGMLDGLDSVNYFNDSTYKTFITAFNYVLQKREAEQIVAQYQNNLKTGKEWMEKVNAQPGVIALPSGLSYIVNKEGTGKKAKENSIVKIHYKIYTLNGKLQKDTYTGEPEEMTVSDISLPGLAEGIKLMNEGAIYRFFMPAELAWGDRLGLPIPAGSTLIFDLELVNVK